MPSPAQQPLPVALAPGASATATAPSARPAAGRDAAERRRRRATALLLAPGVAWVLVAVVVPIVFIVLVSFWRQDGAEPVPAFDTGAWKDVLTSSSSRSLLLQTLKITAIVLGIVAVVGSVAGYFLARCVRSERVKAILLLLAILPFWTSYVIRVITWQPLFGSRGFVNWTLQQVGLTDQPSTAFLYNQNAQVFAMSSLYVVFVIGPVFWALSRIDPEVLAASRSLGASRWTTFWRIEAPLAKGGLVAGCFFAAIFLLGDFTTERLIGGGTKPGLAGTIDSVGGRGLWPEAAALSVVLLVVAALVLGLLVRAHDLRKEL